MIQNTPPQYAENKLVVSIVVPCYNMESYLRRSVESLLTQDYPNKEILLVDDGSTDSTAEILDRYAAQTPCLKVFHKPNGGLSSARNYGIDRATGDYIMFVDPDDELMPDYISAAVEKIESEELDVVYFGYRTAWYSSPPVPVDYYPLISSTVRSREAILEKVFPLFCGMSIERFAQWLKGEPDWEVNKELPTVWRFIYRLDVLRRSGLRFRNLFSEDLVFNLDVFYAATSVGTLDKITYNYIPFRGGALSVGYSDDRILRSKIDILTQRNRLRRQYLETTGRDILPMYAGSNVVSALQICYALTVTGRYSDWCRYLDDEAVAESIKMIHLDFSGGVKRWFPVAMLKLRAYRCLFLCLKLARKLGIVPNVW